MSKITVGVLRGGPSSEYEVSIGTGANVLRNLPEEKYRPLDLFVDRAGVWHMGGVALPPDRALRRVDVLFNALHGEWGEDGQVQRLLEDFAVPYTGSRQFASALAMNKALAKSFLEREGVKTPPYRIVRRDGAAPEDTARDIFKTFPQPCVVKPVALGSSVGVSVARKYPEILAALEKAFERSETALIEEYIAGREATCGVLDGFRGEAHYPLLPIEIIPPAGSSFFDYAAKYGGRSREICPGNFSPDEKIAIEEAARTVHVALGLRHYSRSDFILHPRRGLYFLEANTLPGLTGESLLPKAIRAVGATMPQFLDHVITLALAGK